MARRPARLHVRPLEDRLTPATVADAGGPTLTVTLAANEQLTVRSTGAGYQLDTTAAFRSAGVQNTNAFTGFGTPRLVLGSAAAYRTLSVQDAGAGATVVFESSGANPYSTSVDVLLDDPAAGEVRLNGTSAFGANSLTVSTARQVRLFTPDVSVTTGAISLSGNRLGAAAGGDIRGGVVVSGGGVRSTGTGTVTLRGQGGTDPAGNQFGVWLLGGAQVVGGTAGATVVDGLGGNSAGSFNHGVYVTAGSSLTTSGSDLRATGAGGSTGAAGSGRNIGVYADGTRIAAGGAGATVVVGTSGNGGGPSNHGVWVRDQNSTITSGGGPVTVTGTAAGTAASTADFGVAVEIGGVITAGGTGAVSVTGTGAPLAAGAAGDNQGVQVSGSDQGVFVRPSLITSGGGPVTVVGKGGGNGPQSLGNIGVYVFSGGQITAGGTAPVSVTGTGGNSAGQENIGVRVDGEFGGDTRITSGGGPVTITGFGGNGQNRFNVGVHLVFGGVVTAGGGAAVNIAGTGGTGTRENSGVVVDFPSAAQFNNGRASLITSGGGPVTVVGKAGPGGGVDAGVAVVAGGQVSAGGTAPLVVQGTGGAGTVDSEFGVMVQGAATSISTAGGPLTVFGQAGGGAVGVLVNQGGRVASGGAGTARVDGIGAGAQGGVVVVDANSVITTAGGNLTAAGRAGPGTAAQNGVVQTNGGRIAAGGTGSTTLDPTGTTIGQPPVPPPVSPPVTPPVTPPTVPPTVNPARLVGSRQFAAGAGAGGGPNVRYFDPNGTERFSTTVFAGDFTGGVRTAAADFTGDGVADLVVGTGPGAATRVRVLDGVTQAVLFEVAPFEAAFTGGVFVAVGDLTGDGTPELIITPDEGGGPRVRVFSGAGFGQVADFLGIDDPNFRGGARAAAGDIDGDGAADLIVAAGFGGGPRVAVYSGRGVGNTAVKLVPDFFVFEQGLRNGAFVAAGDLDGDGRAELIAGGGPGGGPRVRAFSGADLLARPGTPADGLVSLANFFAGDPNSRSGVRVAVKNLDGDNKADLVTSGGPGSGSRVSAYAGSAITPGGTPPELLGFDAFAGFTGGVFVG